MAAGVIYLDVDDEITSAAARIRGWEGSRVAVVLPYGSRVATSRINFRLLARDAMTNGKQLSIIAGDPATRALAASAGLPIFATVVEYETSGEAGRPAKGAHMGDAGPAAAAVAVGPDNSRTTDDATGAVATGAAAATGPAAKGAAPTAAESSAGPDDDLGPMLISETVATPARAADGGAAGAAAAGTGAAGAAAATARLMGDSATSGEPARPSPRSTRGPRGGARAPATIPAARVVADTPAMDLDRPGPRRRDPFGRAFRPSIGRTPLVIGLAVAALALVVGGAGAYLYLPTATAVITPREASIGPVSMRIVASTSATEPDPAGGVVPAQSLTVEVGASDSFPATGQRIEEEKAKGTVRFDNLDPTGSNTIARGAVVSTGSGVQFRTDRAVTVPAAELVGLQIVPSRASVDVTAVDAGPEGNVEPNAIRTVPRGEEPFFLKVTNPDATTGGSRTEFPRIRQEDIDAAITALRERLSAAFDERLDDPDLPGDAATVFPETKALGDPTFAVDPATLVGEEVETFELAATATGTVVAVDTAPVQAVAEARIASSVEPGFALVERSGQVVPAPAEISNGIITFPVVVTARQVLVLDPGAIEADIMGKPLAQAREILATYGEAELTVWPDWVGTIPTIDSRVEVQTVGPGVSDGSGSSASPVDSESSAPAPQGSR